MSNSSFSGKHRRRRAVEAGIRAERRVTRVLSAAGWSILARNWRGAGAELDLIVSRRGSLRFVEVKQRKGRSLDGLDSVGFEKKKKLIRAANAWLARTSLDVDDMAFTVALVNDDGIHWVDSAFDG